MSNHTLPSAKSKRAKVKPKLYNKPHMIIPQEDFDWILQQKPSVIKLWGECWKADAYGSRWMQLNTSLKHSSFSEAKKILTTQGLFIFKVENSIRDSRETVCWMVKNLHGSRVKDYWESIDLNLKSTPADSESINTDLKSTPADSESTPADCISTQTLTQQESCNPSVTSQKHLSNSSKELLRCDSVISSENLLSHLQASERGVLPPKGVIYQLRDSNYWVAFTQTARMHGWDLRELLTQD